MDFFRKCEQICIAMGIGSLSEETLNEKLSVQYQRKVLKIIWTYELVYKKLVFASILFVKKTLSSVTTGVLGNFAKFTGKHLCQSLFLMKLQIEASRIWHRCFPVNFLKLLRTLLYRTTRGNCFWKNKAVTGKSPFFVIGRFWTPRPICLKIGFWQGRFAWKCFTFNLSTFN